MLVLSRKTHEKLVFPGINATVQVVSIRPGVVRLGIEAPREVSVLREEVSSRVADAGLPARPASGTRPGPDELRELNHLLRNRLNVAGIGFALARRQLQAGLTQDAETTLAKINDDLQSLQHRLECQAEKARKCPPASRPKARKALLVEDDRNERELMAGLLRMAGLDVDTAGDGNDALNYLHSHARPDVVLLDMVLPNCDGPTTVREIRRDPAYTNLKIFGVTGHAPDTFHLDSSVDRWFRKPINPEVLLRDLSQELEHSLARA